MQPRDMAGALSARLEDKFDAIDAAFFTGDTFVADEAARRRAEFYLRRWQRCIDDLRDADEPDTDE